MSSVDPAAAASIAAGEHGAPFDVLGIHAVSLDGRPAYAVRAFLPHVRSAALKRGTTSIPMEKVHADGFYEAIVQGPRKPFGYTFAVEYANGETDVVEDPYRFPPV